MGQKRYQTGTFQEFAESKRGWITGQFFPPNTLQHDTLVEVKVVECGPDFRAAKHHHRKGKAWVLVTRGAVHFVLDGEEVTVPAGAFVIQEPECVEEITGADPDTQFIALHAPSVPDNKVVLE